MIGLVNRQMLATAILERRHAQDIRSRDRSQTACSPVAGHQAPPSSRSLSRSIQGEGLEASRRYDDMEQARRSGVGLAFDHGSLRVDEILEGYSAMYSCIVEKGDKLVFVQGVPGQDDAQFPNNEFAKLFGEAIPGRFALNAGM